MQGLYYLFDRKSSDADLLNLTGRISGAGKVDAVIAFAVARLVIAVEEHFHFVYTTVQQSVYTLTARVMIGTDLVD